MLRFAIFAFLLYRIIGKKKRSTSNDLVPRGIIRTIVPESYLRSVHGKHWDSNKYPNQIVIDDSKVESIMSVLKRK